MFLIVSVIATHTILIREVSSIDDPVNQSKQTKGKEVELLNCCILFLVEIKVSKGVPNRISSKFYVNTNLTRGL